MEINKDIENAISDLIQAAYNTGYNAGKGTFSYEPWVVQDKRDRTRCIDFLNLMIERQLEEAKRSGAK